MMKSLQPASSQDRTAQEIVVALKELDREHIRMRIRLQKLLRRVCLHPGRLLCESEEGAVMRCLTCDEELT